VPQTEETLLIKHKGLLGHPSSVTQTAMVGVHGNAVGNVHFLPHDDDPEVVASKLIAPKDIDALLARDMHQMSFKDRDQVTQELHGVMDVVDEKPSMVEERLVQLEMELSMLLDEDLRAYRLAHSINPSYTSDATFRLQFLRAARFHVKNAARRMVRYFREKLDLFGPEKIGKPRITLEDLSEEDKVALAAGYMQWLPERDRSGRLIYLADPALAYWRESYNVVSSSVCFRFKDLFFG
jgi:hypothetical protein